jgi:hypothetical protein
MPWSSHLLALTRLDAIVTDTPGVSDTAKMMATVTTFGSTWAQITRRSVAPSARGVDVLVVLGDQHLSSPAPLLG